MDSRRIELLKILEEELRVFASCAFGYWRFVPVQNALDTLAAYDEEKGATKTMHPTDHNIGA